MFVALREEGALTLGQHQSSLVSTPNKRPAGAPAVPASGKCFSEVRWKGGRELGTYLQCQIPYPALGWTALRGAVQICTSKWPEQTSVDPLQGWGLVRRQISPSHEETEVAATVPIECSRSHFGATASLGIRHLRIGL